MVLGSHPRADIRNETLPLSSSISRCWLVTTVDRFSTLGRRLLRSDNCSREFPHATRSITSITDWDKVELRSDSPFAAAFFFNRLLSLWIYQYPWCVSITQRQTNTGAHAFHCCRRETSDELKAYWYPLANEFEADSQFNNNIRMPMSKLRCTIGWITWPAAKLSKKVAKSR